jgi:CHAT domain-containing protein/Tfp pilus assembly protein PilF
MHYRLKSLSLATATLLPSVTSPLLPLSLKFEPLVVQAQTLEQQKPGEEKWYLEADQLWLKGNYPAALEELQQDLARFRKEGDRARVGAVLACMGMVYRSMGQHTQALEYSQQALALLRQVGQLPNGDSLRDNSASRSTARTWEGRTLFSIALIYVMLGQYTQSLDYSQQALAINREVSDRIWEGKSLWNIGFVYLHQGQYAKALEFFQQTLAINKEVGHRVDQGLALHSIGGVYFYLGQYAKALEFYQQALAIRTQIGDKGGQGQTLNDIGNVYSIQEQYPKALDCYQQALAIHREVGDKREEGIDLNNIGFVYSILGQYPKALEFNQQALAIFTATGNKAMEGVSLTNLGLVYWNLGQYPKALEFNQQALAINSEIGSKAWEGTNLTIMGLLLETQNQPELAIVFYKQSVNVIEGIRKDLRVLPKEQQQSYTETVADRYRHLADLLLKQDRVLEAQRVLDLLKVQELADYLRNVRGNQQTQQGVDYLPPEQQLLTQYNAKLTQVVQLGKELDTLQKIPPEERTPQQEQRRREIQAEQQKLTRDYLDFIRSPQIVALVQQLSRTTGGENLNPQLLRSLQDNLKKLSQDAVLLYPLILDDRLEVVLVTPYAPPIRRPVPVKREELNRTIAEFRSALTNPNSNAVEPAQKLYNWLIQPIEAALKEANAKTIIYAPDGQLRYIPLAALYDGNQWLVQKYRINNITALSLTEWEQKPQTLKILAGAFTQGNYSFQVGGNTFNFGGLPSAGKEVENLASTVPGTTKLFNRDFSQKETVAQMSDYSILHFATHASFVTGQPEDSFILFGNGDRANFRDVETWPLTNTDLVVLSACETGVGGKLGDGTEILGFGYLMQQAGARATIASLWSVDDGGTQVLMNAFYAFLESKNVGQDAQPTKAEALRQAQIALITKDLSAVGGSRGEEAWIEVVSTRTGLPPQVSNNLNHPYYWAPFILIGNGL